MTEPQRIAADADVPLPRESTDDGDPSTVGDVGGPTGGARTPPGRTRAVRARATQRALAVRRWFPDSAVGHLWSRLQLLDFINRGTLFASVLLLCFVPFMITLQAIVGRSAATSVISRFGLDRQAAADVSGVFTSPTNASHAVTGISWVFFVLGGLGAASALGELYQHAFGLEVRGIRDTPRHLAWLVLVVAAGALTNQVGPWLHDSGGVVLYGAVTLIGGIGFWWLTMWLLLAGRRSWRRLLPSAVATGVCWVALMLYFRLTLSGNVTSDNAKYGPIGVVFAVMSLLIAVGVVVILGALAGVVWEERRTARER